MKPLRVLIVGCGLMGRRRYDAIESLLDTGMVMRAAAVDPDESKWLNTDCYESVADVPPDSYDAAFVCVPHDQALGVLARLPEDVPFLVEKPGCVDAAGAGELLRYAALRDAPCFAGFNYRFLPHVAALRGWLAGGHAGELRRLDMVLGHGGSPEMRPTWKAEQARSGGVLVDLGSHLFDLAALLAGGGLAADSCQVSRGWWSPGHADAARVQLHGPGGPASVDLLASTVMWRNTFRVEAWGADGYAIAEGRGGHYGPMTLTTGRRWGWRDAGGAGQRGSEDVRCFGDADGSVAAETESAVRAWLGLPVTLEPAPVSAAADAVRLACECGGES